MENRSDLLVVQPPLGKRYATLVIDPPWPMKKMPRRVRPNQTDFPYPVMTIEQIKNYEFITKRFGDNCHVYLWATQKYLPVASELLKAWGIRYPFTMVWHKNGGFQPVGLPQYNCEFILFGRIGNLKFITTKAFPCCFFGKRREHSRKPEEFYEIVRRVSPPPRIDIFTREKHKGFDPAGNEVDKFQSGFLVKEVKPEAARLADGRAE